MTTNIKCAPVNANSSTPSIFAKARHEIRCLLGKETKIFHYKAGKPKIISHNCENGKDTIVQEGTEDRYWTTYADATSAKIVSVPKAENVPVAKSVRVRLVNGLKISIWLEVALLVARHFVPEIEEQLPAVYSFLDSVALPIINWLYAFAMKCVNWLMSQEWIANIIEFLRNLAV